MDSLLLSPTAPAVMIVAALLVLVLLRKALEGVLKLAATFVLVAVIGLALFQLNELGFLGF